MFKVYGIITFIIIFCAMSLKSCSDCIDSGGTNVKGVIGYECVK